MQDVFVRNPCSAFGHSSRLSSLKGARRRSPGSAAFTLVELLVVIGIIGVLMSMLLPTLNGVRQRAVTLQCATNLRTLGQAWQQYTNANRMTCAPGRLPTAGAPGGLFDVGFDRTYRPRWFELLGAELRIRVNETPKAVEDDGWIVKNPSFLCPTVPDFNNSRNYPYGYNHQFLGNARPLMSGAPGFIRYPVRASSIAGAKTIAVVDSLGTAAGKARLDRSGYGATGSHDPFALLNKGYFIDPPRLTTTSDYADPERRNPGDRSGPDARHQKKANALFCDGHVELMALHDMGYVVQADGSVATSGPGTSNAMFSGNGSDADPPSILGR